MTVVATEKLAAKEPAVAAEVCSSGAAAVLRGRATLVVMATVPCRWDTAREEGGREA